MPNSILKKFILLIICFTYTLDLFAQLTNATPPAPVVTGKVCEKKPVKTWEARYGGGSLVMILSLNDGGYIMGGNGAEYGGVDKTEPTRGLEDFWVLRVDANGNKLWDKTYGGNNSEFFCTLHQTNDGGFMLFGHSDTDVSGEKTASNRGSKDFWVIKIDANGNKQWDRGYGSENSELLASVLPTPDGGYLMGGSSASYAGNEKSQTSYGYFDYWLLKIDANGNKQWDKQLGGIGDDQMLTMTATGDGSYVLGGSSNSAKSYDKSEGGRGSEDYWIVKVDGNGNKIWDKTLGGNMFDYISRIVPSGDGGYVLGGWSNSPISGDKTQANYGYANFWVVKIDANGNKLWDKRYGGNNYDYLNDMIATEDGGFIMAGSSKSDISGDKTEAPYNYTTYETTFDGWLLKIDANGNKSWDKRFGGTSRDDFKKIIRTGNGEYLIAGASNSPISGDITTPLRGDYWLFKINTCQPTSNFCAGQSISLEASGCAGAVIWSTGVVANSISVSTPGTYYATCFADNEMSAQSNPIVIAESTVSLSGTATGGTNNASGTITSTQTIPTGINATYQAGKSISLQGSFQAQTGSVFKAEIKGCE
ncbi:3-coathanger stack domain-containing protein [Emticicia fontis]